jgi:hypothetical protein
MTDSITRIERRMTTLRWMLALNILLNLVILLKLHYQ